MTFLAERAAPLLDLFERLTGRAGSSRQTPIVPPANVAGQALVTVIAIMTFLASLTLGAVLLVSQAASSWQSQVSRELTVQLMPADGFDMAAALERTRALLAAQPGVTGASVMDDAATGRLLEPWLGEGLDLDELPVPRLVIVSIDESAPPDFALLRATLQREVPEARLDDHRAFVDRLVAMARSVVLAGLAILGLVMTATVLTVVFATRGAMSGNRQIIEVLHFVGAKGGFIAAQFQRHFLTLGLVGSLSGGLAAIAVFALVGSWTRANEATPEADQIRALFGAFAIGWTGYAGILALVATVGALTALTSRITVVRQLAAIDMISPVES